MASSGAPTVTAEIKTMTSTSVTITMTCDPSATQWSWRYLDYDTRQWSQWFYDNNSGISRTIIINKLKNNGRYNIQTSAKSSQTNVWGYATEFVAIDLRNLPSVQVIDYPIDQIGSTNLILGKTYILSCKDEQETDLFDICAVVGDWSENIYNKLSPSVATSFSYSLPISVANEMINSNIGTVEFKIMMRNNLGIINGIENSSFFTVEVPQNNNTKPEISNISLTAINGEDFPFGSNNIFVKDLSKLRVSAEASGKYNASIVSGRMEVNSFITSIKGSGPFIFESDKNLQTYGAVPVYVTAIDSRGFAKTENRSITVYDYYIPNGTIEAKIKNIEPMNYYEFPNPKGNPSSQNFYEYDNETGEYILTEDTSVIYGKTYYDYSIRQSVDIDLSWNIASVNNLNTKNYKLIRQIKFDEIDWTDDFITSYVPGSYSGSDTFNQTVLPTGHNYRWKLVITDSIYNDTNDNAIEYTAKISQTPIAISRLNGGGGVTFFGEAQETGLWVVENGTYKNVTVGNARSFYGTCNTIGSEAVKEVSCEQFGVTDLVNGTTIKVKFNERNSANHSNLFLNVNNTGAFSIVYPNGNLCLLENIKTFVYYENVVEDVTERKWICIDTELINKSLSKVFNVDEYYEIEDPDPNANPSGLGWYEYVDYDYVLTEDTVVNTEKTYYEIQKMSLDGLSNYIISNTFFINTNWLEQNDPLLTTIGPNVEGILFNLQSSSNLVKDTYQIFMSINPTTIYSRFHNYSGGGGQSFSGWENWSRSNIQVDQTRRVLIFGDSYFRPNPIGGGNSVGSYLSGYLANTNILYAINSQGGEGFAVETPGYNFLDDIDTFVPPFNNREVTDIIFAGGYNDRNFSISNIENGIDICFNACRSKYPNAKLHIGHFGWHAGLHSEQRFKCIANSIPAYRSASKHGASYMVNSEYTMHYYDLFVAPSVDYIHPNSDGCREIAKQVALYLNTGTCDVHYPYKRLYFNYTGSDYPFISPPGGWTNTSYSIGSALDNDKVRIYMPDGTTYYATGSDNFELPVGSYTALLALTTTTDVGYRLHFIGMYDGTDSQGNPKPGAAIGQGHLLPNIPVKGLIGKSGDYNSVSQLECVLSAGSLWARNYSVKSDYSNYKTITGIKWLELGGGMFTIPTLEC